MTERKLRSRRRKFPKGKAIRVSNLVYETFDRNRRGNSWDWLFRRLLGLPDRAGNEQPLIEGVLETATGRFFLRLPEGTWDQLEEKAYEVAIMNAARNRTKKICKPIRMRELP